MLESFSGDAAPNLSLTINAHLLRKRVAVGLRFGELGGQALRLGLRLGKPLQYHGMDMQAQVGRVVVFACSTSAPAYTAAQGVPPRKRHRGARAGIQATPFMESGPQLTELASCVATPALPGEPPGPSTAAARLVLSRSPSSSRRRLATSRVSSSWSRAALRHTRGHDQCCSNLNLGMINGGCPPA